MRNTNTHPSKIATNPRATIKPMPQFGKPRPPLPSFCTAPVLVGTPFESVLNVLPFESVGAPSELVVYVMGSPLESVVVTTDPPVGDELDAVMDDGMLDDVAVASDADDMEDNTEFAYVVSTIEFGLASCCTSLSKQKNTHGRH